METTRFLCWLAFLLSLLSVVVHGKESKNITLTVKISFQGKQPKSFPKTSCLVLMAQQGGIMDAPAKRYARAVIREPKLEAGGVMKAKLEFPLPAFERVPREISISATINNGWCSDGKEHEWIRTGDYFNDTNFGFRLKAEDSLQQYIKIFLVPYL